MAAHHFTTRTVVHHEWTLTAPVHYTDMEKALHMACMKREDLGRGPQGSSVGSVHVFGRDELVVISFTEEK